MYGYTMNLSSSSRGTKYIDDIELEFDLVNDVHDSDSKTVGAAATAPLPRSSTPRPRPMSSSLDASFKPQPSAAVAAAAPPRPLLRMNQNPEHLRIARKYCPIYLHSRKSGVLPCAPERYIRQCALLDAKGQVICSGADIDAKQLADAPPDSTLSPMPDARAILFDANTPIYYVFTEHDSYNELQYVVFYATNPGYDICCQRVGYHPSDFEHVTIHLTKRNVPLYVYFSAHGSKQGEWVPYDETNRTELIRASGVSTSTDTALNVFVANGSNAAYCDPGTYWRIAGFANDVADGEGCVWYPNQLIAIDEDTPWNKFKGSFGNGHVSAPAFQGWWRNENGETISRCSRLFGCCWW